MKALGPGVLADGVLDDAQTANGRVAEDARRFAVQGVEVPGDGPGRPTYGEGKFLGQVRAVGGALALLTNATRSSAGVERKRSVGIVRGPRSLNASTRQKSVPRLENRAGACVGTHGHRESLVSCLRRMLRNVPTTPRSWA